MKKNTYLNDLTQVDLKRRLHYSPKTGIFAWKAIPIPDPAERYSDQMVKRFNSLFSGRVAGSVDWQGYLIIGFYSVTYKAHRLAFLYMTGRWPNIEIDHLNHNRSDNRWKNIRECTGAENSKNRAVSICNISGVTGVHWNTKNKAWRACVQNQYLGHFQNFDDAVAARKAAEIKYNFHPNHGI